VGLAGAEPTPHHFAGDAGGRGRSGDDLSITRDTQELAIAANGLEIIGARTDIRAQSDHGNVVGTPWTAASVLLQGPFIDLHDTQHSLGTDY
jgi:hypothetical protein